MLLAWTTTKKPINAEIPSEHEQKPNKQKRVNALKENNMTPEGRVHNRFGGMRDWAIFRGDTRDGG